MMILFPPCVSMTVSHAPLLKHCDILLIRLNSAKLKALYTWKHSKCFWSPSWFKQCIFGENPIDVISKSGLSQESPFSVWRTLWSPPKITEARSFFKKKKTFVILTKLSSSELSKREDKERSQNSVKILQSKFISIFLNCHWYWNENGRKF